MKTLLLNFINDIRKNIFKLIAAFILAFGVWVVVSINVFPTIERPITGIGIEAQPTDFMVQNNLEIVSGIGNSANITIEGKRYDISDLRAADFYANIDLSSVRSAGTYTLPLNVLAKTDRDCTITETEPLAVTITIDEIITKEFPVTATAPDISLPAEFYAGEINPSIDTISITGSSNVLNSIAKVEARSTFHGELSESHRTNSEIYLYGSNGTRILPDGLTLSTDNISVDILIYKQKELTLKFSVTNYPNNFDISSLKYEIQPSSIVVASPDESIDNLSELNIGTIDINDIELSKTSFIPITLPDGYKNLSGNNVARIMWDNDTYGKLDFTVNRDNITITNIPDNFDVSLVTKEITVTAVGPSEDIANLSPDSFNITVNLLGVTLRAGTQDVSISVQIRGSNQTCWVTGEYTVSINASAE